ncbi:MAG: hypothetical protein KatS3mg044_0771 [Rhodothermaceae bacterium]|nr:MAG: hypothetical protein KatS3mg044_0771 [Rhodothermaceae bacterium]
MTDFKAEHDPAEDHGGLSWDTFLGRLSRLAVRACGCPVAVITLVDDGGAHRIAAWAGMEPGDEAAIARLARRILEENRLVTWAGQELASMLASMRLPQGAPRFAVGRPIRDHQGRPMGTLCLLDTVERALSGEDRFVLHDLAHLIAERMEERRVMQEAERRAVSLRRFYEEVLNELPIEVEVLDAEARYVWANRAMATEDRLPQMIGKTALEYGRAFGLDEALYRQRHEYVRQVLDRGEMGSVEETVLMPDGSERHLLHVVLPVRGDDGQVERVIGYRLDQTEIKNYELRLVAAKEQAEALSRLKSALLANMNHEVRTPLTSIIGFADILRNYLGPDQRELVDLIRRNGLRLMDTLNAVLDMAQLESGVMRLRPSLFDLNDLVLEVVAPYRAEAEQRAIRLRVDLPGTSVSLFQDHLALTRVLHHLLSNAFKFTEQGEVRVEVSTDADRVRIGVVDTGIGIRAASFERIFEPFTQESEGMDRSFDGMGLGLAVARSLVRLMGGTIHVASEPEQGSRFVVEVPHRLGEAWVQLRDLNAHAGLTFSGDGAVASRRDQAEV